MSVTRMNISLQYQKYICWGCYKGIGKFESHWTQKIWETERDMFCIPLTASQTNEQINQPIHNFEEPSKWKHCRHTLHPIYPRAALSLIPWLMVTQAYCVLRDKQMKYILNQLLIRTRALKIEVEPFLFAWFILTIWTSIFPRAFTFGIFTRNFARTSIT